MQLLSFLSGKTCFNCGQIGSYYCLQCSSKLELFHEIDYATKQYSKNFLTQIDQKENFPLDQVIVLTYYHQKGVKKLLRHAKFYGKYQAYRDIIFPNKYFFLKHILQKNCIFVPVPLHIFRKYKRGFNQSEKIARSLHEFTDIPVVTDLLYRKKYTIHQSHLTKSERQLMLLDAFYVKNVKKYNKNTIIYLVDDVISSGSTLIECAKVLHAHGFMDIRAVAIASD